MVYCTEWFVHIEKSLHPWDKSHLIMVYDLIKVLYTSATSALAPIGSYRVSSKTLCRSGPGSYGVTASSWIPVHVKLCVYPPGVESVFPSVLWSSCTQTQLAIKAKCSRGSSSPCQIPRLGNLTSGSELSLLGENLCEVIIIQQFLGHPPGGNGIWLFYKTPFLPSHCSFFFVFVCRICFLVGSIFDSC